MMNTVSASNTLRTPPQFHSTEPEVVERSPAQTSGKDRFDLEAQTHTHAPKQQVLPSSAKVLQAIARAPQAPQHGLRTAQHRVGCYDGPLGAACGVAMAGCLVGGSVMLGLGLAGAGQPAGGINMKLVIPGAVLAAVGVASIGASVCCYDGPLC